MTGTPIFLSLKAVVYRFYSSAVSLVLVYVITGKMELALTVGVVDFLVKICTYMFFDLVWGHLFFRRHKPAVIWLTGLSGAGKSTIANDLITKLRSKQQPCLLLDGDELRELFPNTGFDKESRLKHMQRTTQLAAFLESKNIIAVMALIGPYREARDEARSMCKNFKEVYISTPLAECERRDAKGLYAKARSGEIKQFTGIDAPYEAPLKAELVIDTSSRDVTECVNLIIKELKRG